MLIHTANITAFLTLSKLYKWCAYAPDLEDVVVATGATRDETIDNFRDAVRGLLDYKRDEGQPVPDVTEVEIRETVLV